MRHAWAMAPLGCHVAGPLSRGPRMLCKPAAPVLFNKAALWIPPVWPQFSFSISEIYSNLCKVQNFVQDSFELRKI
jgi:hypothetical protein